MSDLDQNIYLPEFRFSYPNLYEPKEYDGQVRYSLVALFEKGEELEELKDLIEDVAVDFFGAKRKANLEEAGKLSLPIKVQGYKFREDSGDKYLPDGFVKGAYMLNLKSKDKPGVRDHNNKSIIEPSEVYGGCWGTALVRVAGFDKKGNTGVTLYLQHVQKTGDDEPFGNRISPEDAFQKVAKRKPRGENRGRDVSDDEDDATHGLV